MDRAGVSARLATVSLIASALAACGGPSSQASHVLPAAASRGTQAALAAPIGARALPIGARAIPIGARALAINSTNSPKTAPVCAGLLGALGTCSAIRRLDVIPALGLLAGLVPGYQPSDLAAAYDIPPTGGAGQTIGIVVAYNNPHADADLAAYRSTFGLPACRESTGCLRIISANGGAALPASDESWGQELSIDLDMASATCAACRLLVVEAASADIDLLTQGMQTAVGAGATVVSNSYSTPETPAVAAENARWNHPGVPIVAGAGDSGYGVGWPAASSYVTAVGGTTLLPLPTFLGFLETAWGKTGSGCSKYIGKPSWQHDSLCKKRTVNDVAAIADPTPGVAVYDTYFANAANAGWNVYGGTSVSTPIVAGLYALAGNGRSINDASGVYTHTSSLHNIILGANALCLSYLCTAGFGYNGPTGLGTPNGIGAF